MCVCAQAEHSADKRHLHSLQIRTNMILLVIFCSILPLCLSRIEHKGRLDESSNPWLLATSELPIDHDKPKYMPVLGNGQVALNVYSTAIRVNCLYNGQGDTSHRARLPGYANYRFRVSDDLIISSEYGLYLDKAAFYELVHTDEFSVQQTVLVHRRFTRTIVNLVSVNTKRENNNYLHTDIQLNLGQESLDLDLGEEKLLQIGPNPLGVEKLWYRCGATKQVEDATYQPNKTEICVAWTEPESLFVVGSEMDGAERIMITIVDSDLQGIMEELEIVTSQSVGQLLEEHFSAWDSIWSTGNVHVEGDLHLARTVLSSQYYLYSSMPFPHLSYRALPAFCGLSPGGLSYGGPGADYQGHTFWDTEIWMYPSLLVLQPSLAQQLLDYRAERLPAARDLAINTGWKGVRFPWESAFTGRETCPAWAATTRDNQQHISADVSFAMRQYLAVSGDIEWFAGNSEAGCQLARGVAEFFISRATFNETRRQFDINHVMGPDEDHEDVNNNVFTNTVAGLAIFFADFLHCAADCPDISQEWVEKARALTLEWDDDLQYHPQYSGYQEGTQIKQADVVLLGFPLMYNMTPAARKNDLKIYEEVVRNTGPAMTWSMHAIGHLELLEYDEAELFFNKSYQPYVTQPFYVWTEVKQPEFGAVNFETGMGGFLQGVLFGYLGLRTRLDRMEFMPSLPPRTTSLNVTHINFHQAIFSISIFENATQLDVIDAGNGLKVEQGDDVFLVEESDSLTLRMERFQMRPLAVPYLENCKLPDDKIGEIIEF